MSNRVVRTSKCLAAQRQIHAAITHWQRGDFECAITLCSAAEGQMLEPAEPTHLFGLLQRASARNPPPDGGRDDFNYASNWMKHAVGNEEVEIAESEVMLWLCRAVSKYRAIHGAGTPEMIAVFPWASSAPPSTTLLP
jgi:hypothetical protein